MSIAYDSLPVTHGTGEILKDCYDWRTSKLKTDAVALELDFVGRSQRMFDCGSTLSFAVSATNEMRLYRAFFCKDRMCPSCQRRRSLVLFHQVKDVCQSIQNEHPSHKYLMLTLTVPNVKADKLSNEITHLMKSWDRLTKRKEFKANIRGSFRALEITYNSKRDDYHPHFHVLLCVQSVYLKRDYITQSRWLELWQESTRYPHITQVDIRAIRPNKNRDSDSLTASAAEVAKYSTKPSDYISKSPTGSYAANKSVVNQLAKSLTYRRLVSFGGLMKAHAEKLNLKDVNSNEIDLINIDGDKANIDAVMVKVFRWNVGFTNYIG
jgi:plasmid rolling circle replication initiator protein Rep